MHTVTSFHASAVEPDTLSAVMTEYVSVERARVIRRLLVARLGMLAVIPAILGFVLHWLTAFASWFSIGVFVSPAAGAWIVELRRARRLARRLGNLPSSTSYVVPSQPRKVVKSS
jgi:hypothetical protein